jgi:hypothetical protein
LGDVCFIGNLKHFVEQLQWATNFDIRKQMLQGLKEIGSIIFWMSLLDTAMVNVLCKMSLIASAYWNLIYNKAILLLSLGNPKSLQKGKGDVHQNTNSFPKDKRAAHQNMSRKDGILQTEYFS